MSFPPSGRQYEIRHGDQVAVVVEVGGGLLRWRSWDAVREEPNRVTMRTRLHPLTGYPFLLDVEVDYRLAAVA